MDPVADPITEVTLESLSARLDAYEADSRRRDDQLGMQMNWLCENLQSLFLFTQRAAQNGGGIRGMIQTLRQAPPELLNQQIPEVPNNE